MALEVFELIEGSTIGDNASGSQGLALYDPVGLSRFLM